MKDRIEKLIREYSRKIQMCDDKLESISADNRTARKNGDENLMQIYREERREWESRRAAYIQARVDIDSILDGVE
jgi:hypothetical protein